MHGHFVLSSGLHSNTYIQCAKIFENPSRAMNVCELLANKIRKELIEPIDLILSPAIGGIIVGYEIGRQLGIRTIFANVLMVNLNYAVDLRLNKVRKSY